MHVYIHVYIWAQTKAIEFHMSAKRYIKIPSQLQTYTLGSTILEELGTEIPVDFT